jgi:cell division protein FtsB
MSFLKSFYNNCLSRINAYALVTIGVIALTFTAGDSNLYTRYTYDEKIRKLEKEIKYYQDEIKLNKEKLNSLRTDREGLERFAREEYYMKKPDEDVFIIRQR